MSRGNEMNNQANTIYNARPSNLNNHVLITNDKTSSFIINFSQAPRSLQKIFEEHDLKKNKNVSVLLVERPKTFFEKLFSISNDNTKKLTYYVKKNVVRKKFT
jgi:hypothetical protein